MARPAERLVVTILLLLLQATVPAASSAAAPSQADAILAWKSSLGDPPALSTWTNATTASRPVRLAYQPTVLFSQNKPATSI
jgi:hypothetical protein